MYFIYLVVYYEIYILRKEIYFLRI